MKQKFDIAAFVWPAYTGDEPRSLQFWPKGIGEWQSVIEAQPKFEGHQWPRKPLWGYCNEANPAVMEMQINEAVRHGVNVFVYDWYWYDRRPYLEQCLNEGFLKAANKDLMKFYIMWANHDVNTLWDKRLASDDIGPLIWSGVIERKEFEIIVHRWIDKYFCQSNYYKIDGKPVFMIHDVRNFIQGMGGLKEARNALDFFREETVKAGHPGLHLQLTVWGGGKKAINVSGLDMKIEGSFSDFVEPLGIESLSHYHWFSFTDMNRDYAEIIPDAVKEYHMFDDCSATYFPQVSLGWDNNPRFIHRKKVVCLNNTPENIEKALRAAKAYSIERNLHPLIYINSWNEWTETSYLQPDDLYGYGYLNAVKKVFVDEE